jgi:aspartate aminotransferase
MNAIQLQATGGICTAAQAAAVAALDGPKDYLAERNAIYRERRDLVLSMLSQVEGLSCLVPEGAFYVFPGLEGLLGKTTPAGTRIDTDTDFVLALLAEAQVTTVQGSAYGMSPYFRISYAAETEELREGCQRIVDFCNALT